MLETKDLILKSGEEKDWRDLYNYFWLREETFRYMFKTPCRTVDGVKMRTNAYVNMHKEVKTEFFVYEKSTKTAIGIAGIKEMQPGIFTVTDIAVGPDYWGRGYGKQILQALIKLTFEKLQGKELLYDCFRQNEASKGLALSCGFAYTHSEEAELLKDDEKVILDYYKLEAQNAGKVL